MIAAKVRRILAYLVLLIATAGVAYVLGTQAGALVNSRKVDRYKERRAENEKAILEQMGTIAAGDTLPDFYFQDLNGDQVYLRDLINERALIMYFEPDCELCLVELEMVQAEVTDTSQFGNFLMISGANPLYLIKLRDRYDIRSPLVYDYEGFFHNSLKVFTFPFNLVVDKDLVIVEILAGGLTPDEVLEIASGD